MKTSRNHVLVLAALLAVTSPLPAQETSPPFHPEDVGLSDRLPICHENAPCPFK
jgi:hypothetical protein